ncbi:MAG TPA: CBS domain-containing protein [Pyrinomonadaceae bacterium]|jgi:CBS domain-containing protein|nr:CBS domain-containing protein [Chthoniobacterales bacterium]
MEVAGTVGGILAQKVSTVWSIAPTAMIFDAIALMADKNIGALPVVENDKLIGIISERDYTRKVILKGKSSKETRVQEIMTQQLVTANPGDTVVDCMRVMTEKRVRHLPVMEEGKMTGMLSIGDVVKWLISAQAATIDNLEQYISGASLD